MRDEGLGSWFFVIRDSCFVAVSCAPAGMNPVGAATGSYTLR